MVRLLLVWVGICGLLSGCNTSEMQRDQGRGPNSSVNVLPTTKETRGGY